MPLEPRFINQANGIALYSSTYPISLTSQLFWDLSHNSKPNSAFFVLLLLFSKAFFFAQKFRNNVIVKQPPSSQRNCVYMENYKIGAIVHCCGAHFGTDFLYTNPSSLDAKWINHDIYGRNVGRGVD